MCPPLEGADRKIYITEFLDNLMDTNILEEVGLTESEAKVYLALLKLGETTAGPVVDEAKVTRSKIYDILERLKNKGLVSHITKESTKYFSATDPSNILDYLDKKENEIINKKESVKNLLPQLEQQYKQVMENKIAEIYMGMKGMQNAFNLLVKEFSSKEEYYAFGAGKGENVEKIQIFFNRLHRERIKKKVNAKIIFNKSSRGFFKSQEKSNFVQVKYLIESTPTAINIYKNYTIISILTEEPITFLIRNNDVASSFKEYFKVMWDIAKS